VCQGSRYSKPIEISTQFEYHLSEMVFLETRVFIKLIDSFLSDERRFEMLDFLAQQPDAGELIRGGGGSRKVRWTLSGKGKSGGLRIIYVWSKTRDQILFLLTYPKSEKSDLTAEEIKLIAKEAKLWL
jgi:mRNA-degrading endonuclease RelE of RelBE toxin-antitoxin system